MGYDGKRVAELNRLRAVGGREVGTFWQENAGVIIAAGFLGMIFFVVLWAVFLEFREAIHQRSTPQQEQKAEEGQVKRKKEDIPRFYPPLLEDIPQFFPPSLFNRPTPPSPRPLPWQRRGEITPINWSGGHHDNGHDNLHGHHYPHYSYPYYGGAIYDYGPGGYRVVPRFSSFGSFWGGEGTLREQPRRPYFRQQRPNGTVTEWGLR